MAKFKVGDKVRVRDFDEIMAEGKGLAGIPELDYRIVRNGIHKIKEVCQFPHKTLWAYVLSDGKEYEWPEWALEPVDTMSGVSHEAASITPHEGIEAPPHMWPFPDTVSVLGVTYRIEQKTEERETRLKGLDGFVDWTTKTIVLRSDVEGNLGIMDEYAKKVFRHEITHAFIIESGLSDSAESGSWATSEEAVDWIAWQGPKLMQAWKEAGCL